MTHDFSPAEFMNSELQSNADKTACFMASWQHALQQVPLTKQVQHTYYRLACARMAPLMCLPTA